MLLKVSHCFVKVAIELLPRLRLALRAYLVPHLSVGMQALCLCQHTEVTQCPRYADLLLYFA